MQNKIKKFIKENRWIIVVSIIFLIWKFFLVGVLWHGRMSPPEPDDSYVYIGHIESVRQCPTLFCKDAIYPMNSTGGFLYLSYRLFFGYLSLILGISAETMYHWSFYMGSVMLLPILIFFLSKLTGDKNLIAFSLLFMLLPNGGGSSHSFFWIAPAFFALILFFLLLSYFIDNKIKLVSLFLLLVPLGLFTHTIFLYFIIILVLIFIWAFIFEKKWPSLMFKKLLVIILFFSLIYVPLSIYLSRSSKGVVYGIEKFGSESVQNIFNSKEISNKNSTTINPVKKIKWQDRIFPGFKQTYNDYLKWFLLNPGMFLLSMLFVFILLNYFREYKMLSIFLAGLLFSLLASINKYGFRSLIFFAPINFIFFSWGFWYGWKWLKNNFFIQSKLTLFLSKIIFILAAIIIYGLNLTFSLLSSEYANQKSNYKFNNQYVDYLKNNLKRGDKIAYLYPTINTLFIKDNLRKIPKVSDPAKAKFFITLKEEDEDIVRLYDESLLNKLLKFISKITLIKRPEHPAKKETSEPYKTPAIVKESFTKSAEFEDLIIYVNQSR